MTEGPLHGSLLVSTNLEVKDTLRYLELAVTGMPRATTPFRPLLDLSLVDLARLAAMAAALGMEHGTDRPLRPLDTVASIMGSSRSSRLQQPLACSAGLADRKPSPHRRWNPAGCHSTPAALVDARHAASSEQEEREFVVAVTFDARVVGRRAV